MTGRTRFSEKTLAKVVNAATESVPGVVKVTTSWTDIGTRSYPRCEVRTDQLAGIAQVHSFIAVSWPSPATDIAQKVQSTISAWVSAMTGLHCTQVNVTVEQTVESVRRVAPEEVASAPTTPRLLPVQISAGTPITSPVTRRATAVTSPMVRPPHPVTSPVTAAQAEPYSPALPRAAQLRSLTVPAELALRPVRVPAEHRIASVRIPAEPRVAGSRAPQLPPVRSVQIPLPVPLLPVQLPREQPLHPVGVPAPRDVEVRIPGERPLTSVHIRGTRFTSAYRQGGEPRVR